MDSQAKAVKTMQEMIDGQLKAIARIYGSVENIPARRMRTVGAMICPKEHPEMLSVAPYTGDFTVGKFKISRTDIDHQIRITVRMA